MIKKDDIVNAAQLNEMKLIKFMPGAGAGTAQFRTEITASKAEVEKLIKIFGAKKEFGAVTLKMSNENMWMIYTNKRVHIFTYDVLKKELSTNFIFDDIKNALKKKQPIDMELFFN